MKLTDVVKITSLGKTRSLMELAIEDNLEVDEETEIIYDLNYYKGFCVISTMKLQELSYISLFKLDNPSITVRQDYVASVEMLKDGRVYMGGKSSVQLKESDVKFYCENLVRKNQGVVA